MLASLAAFAGQAAVIYKWTDGQGVVHYSDQPVPGAQKIYTASPSAAASSGAVPNATAQASASAGSAAKQGYSIIAVSSPSADQSFFGDEPISVALALEPTLKPGDTISWHLNGKELEDQGPAATQFSLPHLERGTYAVAATVTDPQSGQSQSTPSVTFYVRQPSALSPLHRKP